MQTYDISVKIDEQLPVWPGDPAVVIKQDVSMDDGEMYNLHSLQISAHTGTHIDAPLHFLAQGKPIGAIPLDYLIGPAQVIEIPDEVHAIDAEIIRQCGIVSNVKKVLFKTANSQLWGKHNLFHEAYTALNSNGAKVLAEMDIHLVGVDYLSISVYEDTARPHILLLQKDVVLLEGINLSDVEAGIYELICLPLKLNDIEGAPARAILRR